MKNRKLKMIFAGMMVMVMGSTAYTFAAERTQKAQLRAQMQKVHRHKNLMQNTIMWVMMIRCWRSMP